MGGEHLLITSERALVGLVEAPQRAFEFLDRDNVQKAPYGTSWGFYTPPGTTFDKQLEADQRPERQTLIEVMSGHGFRAMARTLIVENLPGAGGIAALNRTVVAPPDGLLLQIVNGTGAAGSAWPR